MLKSFANEFKAFIMRGNVIDLAVGVVIGAAFTGIVDTIVKGVFGPIIGLITPEVPFKDATIPIWGQAKIQIGLVIMAVINFVIVGFCLFTVVKAMNRFMKREETKPADPTPSEKLLTEIRDLLKK